MNSVLALSEAKSVDQFFSRYELSWSKLNLTLVNKPVDRIFLDDLTEIDAFGNFHVEVRKGNSEVFVDSLSTGDMVSIIIEPLRNNDVFYAQDLNDLFKTTNLTKLPVNICIPTLGYASWKDETSAPKELGSYLKLSDLISKFIEVDVCEKTDMDTLSVFSAGDKLNIVIDISYDLINKNAERINAFSDSMLQLLDEDIYLADKSRIIRAALLGNLKPCSRTSRFIHLIEHCDELKQLVNHNYELFVSGFSFSSEKDELLEKKREYSNSLNKLIADIQGKLLATPIALILAVAGMKTEAKDNPLFVNSVIVLGASVFLVFMIFLLLSHSSALKSIKADITNKKARLKMEIPNLYDDIELNFKSLETQAWFNSAFICVLWLVLLSSYGFTWFSFFKQTPF